MGRLSDALISFVGIRISSRYPEEIVVSFVGTYVCELTRKTVDQLFSSDRFRSRRVSAFDRFHYAYHDDVYAFDAPRSLHAECEYDEGQTATAFLNPNHPDDIWFENRCQVGKLIQATADPVGRWLGQQSRHR
ncbi:hypothetical protein RSSM_02475 [Rhodopirellula sallentina SM41]|uniref:Uncharacterized protein n=1 Tax=Rhodopirellula sallentina SM41 TaxID=1263870 RepID=M5U3W1_9BACT|nr:hypothetical protein RSSM_02475 [Rhodopirellula sallentina SM41]